MDEEKNSYFDKARKQKQNQNWVPNNTGVGQLHPWTAMREKEGEGGEKGEGKGGGGKGKTENEREWKRRRKEI